MEAGVSILTMICQQMEATYGWVEEVEAAWQGLTVGNANSEDINLAANVTTGQVQKYNGPVVITGGDRTLTTNTNQRVNFSSTINSDGTARAYD